MKKTTQYHRILEHLEKFGSITSLEAFRDYGITRLSAIIFELRKFYKIESKIENGKNRFGDATHFAKYTLKGDL